jgi:uncharacterized protein YbjT (DUF2867 family)
MKALIVGASGLIGSKCLEQILSDESFTSVEIWVRNYTGISHLKLTEKVIDFDKLSELNISGIDHVFCCLGTTINKAKSKEAFARVDKEYVIELAILAEKSGCRTFLVVSSIGANKNAKNFYLKTKGEMEDMVKKCSIPAIYILQPSMLQGNRKEFRFGELIGKVLMRAIKFMLVGGMRKYRGIQASTVATAMILFSKRKETGIFTYVSDKIIEAVNYNKS